MTAYASQSLLAFNAEHAPQLGWTRASALSREVQVLNQAKDPKKVFALKREKEKKKSVQFIE